MGLVCKNKKIAVTDEYYYYYFRFLDSYGYKIFYSADYLRPAIIAVITIQKQCKSNGRPICWILERTVYYKPSVKYDTFL